MAKQVIDQSVNENESKVRAPYETPAIIYEGLISTRAGTPVSVDNQADVTDIFNN